MSTVNDVTQRPDGYFNLLHNTICSELETNPPNSEVFWVAMGNELESTGITKNEISEMIRKDIENELYESQFKEFLSREKYVWYDANFMLVMRKNEWFKSDVM